MPILRGAVRRANVGKGQTTTTSVSFATSDYTFCAEQARLRNCSFSLIIGEAIGYYRREMSRALAEIERESDGRTREGKTRRAAATSTPPAEAAEAPVAL